MIAPRTIARYGWRRDSLDTRDWRMGALTPRETVWPPAKSIRPTFGAYDQGQLGSCTANALAAAVEYQQTAQHEGSVTPSRLFIYWYERYLEGTVASDAGAEIRDGAKVVAKYGAPPETDWPYDIAQFTVQPPQQATTDATQHRATRYYRINQDEWDLKWCINNGYPFVFGFTVYDSFEAGSWFSQPPYVMPLPQSGEGVLGGHAVLGVGYDDAKGVEVRNSWGTGWGDAGHFYMPWSFITNPTYAADFWTLRRES